MRSSLWSAAGALTILLAAGVASADEMPDAVRAALKELRRVVASTDADSPGWANSPKTQKTDGYLSSAEIHATVKALEAGSFMGLESATKKQRDTLLAFLPAALAGEAKGDARGAPYMSPPFYDYARGLDGETLAAAIQVDALEGDNDGMISPDEEKKIAHAKLKRRQDELRVHCGPAAASGPAVPLRSK